MKIYAWLALGALIVAAVGGGIRWAYTSGYNARDAEAYREIAEAERRGREQADAEWAETMAQAEPQIVIEEKIVERIRYVNREIPTVVREFIPAECRDLGAEYARLRNEQVRAANNHAGSDAAADLAD